MGLDGVELVMNVEDTFGITIDDADASKMITAGQLHQYVSNKVQSLSANSCATQKCFYVLRKHASTALNIPTKKIRPDTPVDTLFPLSERRFFWKKISHNAPFKLPKLDFSIWVYSYLTLVYVIGFILICNIIWESCKEASILVGLIVMGFFVWLTLWSFRLLMPFLLIHLPRSCKTLGDLSKIVLSLNIELFKPLSEKEVWNILVDLISEQLGIDKNSIKPGSRFVEDLGLS